MESLKKRDQFATGGDYWDYIEQLSTDQAFLDYVRQLPTGVDTSQLPEQVQHSLFRLGAISMMNAVEQAERISQALHNGGGSLNGVRALLSEQPMDATTLFCLLELEREKKAGDLEKELKAARASLAARAAQAKLKLDRDGKQAAKSSVFRWWEKWSLGQIEYDNKTDFARAMLDKHPTLTSEKRVTDWCREWERSV